MKQLLQRSLTLLFVALVASFCANAAVEITYTSSSTANLTQDGVTVAISGGSTTAQWYSDGFRTYQGATITISAASNIESIVFEYGVAKNGCLTVTQGSFDSASKTWTPNGGTYNSVEFKVDRTSSSGNGQVKLNKITVTLADGADTPVVTVAKPEISPAEGTVAAGTQVTITCDTTGANIYYTLDGSAPSNASTPYTAALTINETTTVKAIAYVGTTASEVATATYTVETSSGGEEPGDLPATAIWIAKDVPNHPTNGQVWSSGDIDAYTSWTATKGGTNDPKYYDTGEGLRVYSGGTFTITSSRKIATVKLTFAGTTGYTFSSSNTTNPLTEEVNGKSIIFKADRTCRLQKIEIVYADGGSTPGITVAMPTFSPAAGAVEAGTQVNIACATEGASIYYTLDNTDPSTASTLYTGALTINATTTVKAIAVKDGTSSAIATATYTVPVRSTLAEVNAMANKTAFLMGSDLIVTYANGSNVYVADKDNAGVYGLIYKSGLNLKAGDVIAKGWAGQTLVYGGLLELVPDATVTASSTAAVPDAVVVTDAAALSSLVCARVLINGVTFDAATPAAGNQNYTGTLGSSNVTFRGTYNHESQPAGEYNVLAIVSKYNSTIQVLPIEFYEAGGDLEPTVISFEYPSLTLAVDEEGFNEIYVYSKGVLVEGLTITYSSSNEDVVYVDENTGEILAGEAGHATITATFEGNDTYRACEGSYTVKVVPAGQIEAVFAGWNALFDDYDDSTINCKANAIDWTGTVEGVVLNVKNGTATARYLKPGELRVYNGYTMTFTAPKNYLISGIVTTKGNGKYNTGAVTSTPEGISFDDTNSRISWSGTPAAKVVWTLGNTESFKDITVTLVEGDNPGEKIATRIEFEQNPYNVAFDENALYENAYTLYDADNNEIEGSVTYTVADDAIVMLDEETGEFMTLGEGTTTITATYAGDDTYEGCTATYTVVITDNGGDEPIVPGEDRTTITLDGWQTFFGVNQDGAVSLKKDESINWEGTKQGVTLNVVNGSSTNTYLNATEIRVYNGYSMTFSAPAGYVITDITTNTGGKNNDGCITADSGTISMAESTNSAEGIKKGDVTWAGTAESVVWTLSNTHSFTTINVTIAATTHQFSVSEVKFVPTGVQGELTINYTIKHNGVRVEDIDNYHVWVVRVPVPGPVLANMQQSIALGDGEELMAETHHTDLDNLSGSITLTNVNDDLEWYKIRTQAVLKDESRLNPTGHNGEAADGAHLQSNGNEVIYKVDTKTGTTGIETVIMVPTTGVEYYNLQGVRVANPDCGVYIRVENGKATKVVL